MGWASFVSHRRVLGSGFGGHCRYGLCQTWFVSMDIRSIALALFGATLLIYPSIVARFFVDRHDRRLAQLRRGEDEAYFEERRSLEAYPALQKRWMWRVIGLVFLLLGTASLLLYQH